MERTPMPRCDLSVMDKQTPINNRHNYQESNAHNHTRKVHDVKVGEHHRPCMVDTGGSGSRAQIQSECNGRTDAD